MKNYILFFILTLVAAEVVLGPSVVATEATAAHPYWEEVPAGPGVLLPAALLQEALWRRYWLAQERFCPLLCGRKPC